MIRLKFLQFLLLIIKLKIMNDLQIRIVSNGWIITDRYGFQTVFVDPLDFLKAIATRTLSMEQREKLILRELVE